MYGEWKERSELQVVGDMRVHLKYRESGRERGREEERKRERERERVRERESIMRTIKVVKKKVKA